MTTAERLEARGRAKGRAEGRVQGRTEGQVKALLRLVGLRFGPPDAATEARVKAADGETLDRWIDRILTAESLAALLD